MKKVLLTLLVSVLFFGFKYKDIKLQDEVVYHKVGDKFGGGIVFFIRGNGEHGLVAAPVDQGKEVVWVKGSNFVTKDGVGAGLKNTKKILRYNGIIPNVTAAAKLCDDYILDEGSERFNDWYLPSKLELNILYSQKDIVGGFSNVNYWSSTVLSGNKTWFQDFGNGRQGTNISMPNAVRAIRAF